MRRREPLAVEVVQLLEAGPGVSGDSHMVVPGHCQVGRAIRGHALEQRAVRAPRTGRQAAAANVVVSEIAFHSRQRRRITVR